MHIQFSLNLCVCLGGGGRGGGFKFRILCIPNAISRKFPMFLKRHFYTVHTQTYQYTYSTVPMPTSVIEYILWIPTTKDAYLAYQLYQ